MTPFYQTDSVTLYCGDCQELLPNFPSSSFDCVLTDPPYLLEIGMGNKGCFTNNYKKINSPELLELSGGFPIAESFAEWDRLLRQKTIYTFCSNKQVADIMTAAKSLDYSPTILVWHKYNSVPFSHGTWRQDIEFVLHCKKKPAPMNGGAVIKSKVKRYPIVNGKKKYGHPTAKPIPLLAELLQVGTNPGDLVCDPYCGSATAAIACLETGRRFVGIERDASYCEIAKRRITDWLTLQSEAQAG